jgi:hypothetical protein
MLNFNEWQLAASTRDKILNLPAVDDVEKGIEDALSQFRVGKNPSDQEKIDFLKQLSSLFLDILVNLSFAEDITDHTQALENTKKAREVLRNMLHGTVLH